MKLFKGITNICIILFGTITSISAAGYEPLGSETGEPIPAYALLIADNQHTADHGSSIVEQSYGFNIVTPSARRSAINNMYSLSVMEQVVADEKENGAKLAIHLGDGMNNGCASEWQNFSNSMGKSGLPWFMAPGNHDAFYLGISNPYVKPRLINTLLDSAYGWGRLCQPFRETEGFREPFDLSREPRFIFTKRELIRKYIEELRQREPVDADLPVLDPALVRSLDEKTKCLYETNIKYLHRICWYQNDRGNSWGAREPWSDFIVQELRWKDPASGKVVATVLMDTGDYPQRQKMKRSCMYEHFKGRSCYQFGGISASLSQRQREILGSWLGENKKLGIKTAIMGHHPFRKVEENGIETSPVNRQMARWIERTVARNSWASAIVSAHTHQGYVATRQGNKLAEFNVGSLVDGPIQYMRMNWGSGQNGPAVRFSRILLTPAGKRNLNGFYNKAYFEGCYKTALGDFNFPKRFLTAPDSWEIRIGKKFYTRDAEGLASQLTSFLQEARIYSKVLPERGISISSHPVCYRTDKYGCDKGTLGDTCASYEDVNRCDPADIESGRFNNMSVVETRDDAVALATSVMEELNGLAKKGTSRAQAIRVRRMAARKLEAIRIFDETNPPLRLAKYDALKSCLSLLSSHRR